MYKIFEFEFDPVVGNVYILQLSGHVILNLMDVYSVQENIILVLKDLLRIFTKYGRYAK